MAHSPYTTSAVAFVSENPGCCKWDLASRLTRDSRRCPSKQYYLVNTQIRLGNIVAIQKGNRYELYTPEEYSRRCELAKLAESHADETVRALAAAAVDDEGVTAILKDRLEEIGEANV